MVMSSRDIDEDDDENADEYENDDGDENDDVDLEDKIMPRKDFDHIPGWEGDVEEKANLAREIFFFSHLPEH